MISVLMVCTGNICRSPSAEVVLRHRLAGAGLGARVSVDSAAIEDWNIGRPPHPTSAACGRDRGYDFTGLAARQIEAGDFHGFDLILGMDAGHLAQLQARCPEGARACIALLRDYAPAPPREIADPFGGDRDDFVQALDLIEEAMPGLVAALAKSLGVKG